MDGNNSSKRRSKTQQKHQQQPSTVATMMKQQSKPTPNDSNHLPAHLIAPEARNFAHHKRVGDYFLGEVLGEGSFAKTRLGAHVFSGEKVAVKIINKDKAKKDPYVYKNLRREGQILRKVNHPNIIRLLDVLETENNYYLITTYCNGGEFIDRIEQRKQLSENEVRRHIRQLLDATQQLHALGIVHRDLKVENLLLDSKGNLQVIDFGLSNLLPSAKSTSLPNHKTSNSHAQNLTVQATPLTTSTTNPNGNADQNNNRKDKTGKQSASVESASSAGSPSSSSPYSSNGSNNKSGVKNEPPTSIPQVITQQQPTGLKTQCGSPAYAAPELLAKKLYNEKVDCWSIGVITYALLTGRLPFTVEPFRIQTLYRKMVNGDMNSIPSSVSTKCKNFIMLMLTPEPRKRPSAYEASQHDWLKSSTNSNSTIAVSSIKLKPGSVSQLDSQVVKFMSERLDFIGGLNDIIENVLHSRPSRALAAYFLFQQKFEREQNFAAIDKQLGQKNEMQRRKSLVLMPDGSIKQAMVKQDVKQDRKQIRSGDSSQNDGNSRQNGQHLQTTQNISKKVHEPHYQPHTQNNNQRPNSSAHQNHIIIPSTTPTTTPQAKIKRRSSSTKQPDIIASPPTAQIHRTPTRDANTLMAEQQKRLIYSNPPQRRNTSNQLEKVLSHKPSSGSNAAQTPPRPHSTMVDHDKFARMRLGSLPDTKTSSSKLSNFGKRVNAAKKFFEKAPKWMTKQSSSSSTTSAQQNQQNYPHHQQQQQVITTTNSVPAHATAYPTGTTTTSPSYDSRRHSQAGSSDTVELQSPAQQFGYSPYNGQKQQYTRKSSAGDYRAGYQ